jgi:hypothetical protein
MYSGLLAALQAGGDISARLAAAEAVWEVARDVDFELGAFDAERAAMALAGLALAAQSPEARMRLVEYLVDLSDKLGAALLPPRLCESALVELVPALLAWSGSALLQCCGLRLARALVGLAGWERLSGRARGVVSRGVALMCCSGDGGDGDVLQEDACGVRAGRATSV